LDDYDAYWRWGGFDPNDPSDPISVLGVTEGIRQMSSVVFWSATVKEPITIKAARWRVSLSWPDWVA
jgi:hypothetical protein